MQRNYRLLTQTELVIAKSVFGSSLPYDHIQLANYFLPGNNGVAVTLMSQAGYPGKGIWKDFKIYWGPIVYSSGADNPSYRDTFIHELTHVWQGHNEKTNVFNYMVRSLVSQGWAIATHLDRSKAYEYDKSQYLKWSDYNVEQQANIVSDWFSTDPNRNGGGSSIKDPRFNYIEVIIRPGNPNA